MDDRSKHSRICLGTRTVVVFRLLILVSRSTRFELILETSICIHVFHYEEKWAANYQKECDKTVKRCIMIVVLYRYSRAPAATTQQYTWYTVSCHRLSIACCWYYLIVEQTILDVSYSYSQYISTTNSACLCDSFRGFEASRWFLPFVYRRGFTPPNIPQTGAYYAILWLHIGLLNK